MHKVLSEWNILNSFISNFENILKTSDVCWSLGFVPIENLGLKLLTKSI